VSGTAEQTARLVDRDYLNELGLENKLADWWRLCHEEEQKENACT